jgi:hypothetical protein
VCRPGPIGDRPDRRRPVAPALEDRAGGVEELLPCGGSLLVALAGVLGLVDRQPLSPGVVGR